MLSVPKWTSCSCLIEKLDTIGKPKVTLPGFRKKGRTDGHMGFSLPVGRDYLFHKLPHKTKYRRNKRQILIHRGKKIVTIIIFFPKQLRFIPNTLDASIHEMGRTHVPPDSIFDQILQSRQN